jgi:DNA-binding beta-propeller fold protein YncE
MKSTSPTPRGAARRWSTWHGLLTRLALVLLADAAPACIARAQAPSGMVYVESNFGTPGQENTILAFRRDPQGQLAPLDEFPTGGRGVTPTLRVGPFDTDQNLITNRAGTRLFAVNSGSNTIAVFVIRRDGSLVHVPGSPFPSGGINPVSVGLAGDLLAVVNMNDDEFQDPRRALPNYTTFRVTPRGRLLPIPRAAVPVPNGSEPSQALLTRDGRLLFGADFAFSVPPGFGLTRLDRGVLRSFLVQPNGRLRPVEAQALPESVFGASPARRLPLGLFVHPKASVLYVGFVSFNTLGVYSFTPVGRRQSPGRLRFERAVTPAGDGICWFEANAAGTRLYSSNNFDNTISVFDISQPLNPVRLQTKLLELGQRVPPPGVTQIGAAAPFQLVLDPDEQFLHVVTQAAFGGQAPEANAIHVLPVDDDGTLGTQVEFEVLDTFPSRPQGIVAF